MRSRFTAYVAGDAAYLHRTHEPTAGKPFEPADSLPRVEWLRLVVHRHTPGPTPNVASVEFSATFRDRAGEHMLRENSEFVRTQGGWLYTRALAASAPRVGRNDPCPCGSGRKHKHCCGKGD